MSLHPRRLHLSASPMNSAPFCRLLGCASVFVAACGQPAPPPPAPVSIEGVWTVRVTSVVEGMTLRTAHAVNATKAGDRVTFATTFGCALTATSTGATLRLDPDQRCIVPANTQLTFEAPMPMSGANPYCYGIASIGSPTAPISNVMRFELLGGAGTGGVDDASCIGAHTQRSVSSLIFEFTR